MVLLLLLIHWFVKTSKLLCEFLSWSQDSADINSRSSFKGAVFSVGNHMISSAIWNKNARVNFSKTNKSARARRASAIWGL